MKLTKYYCTNVLSLLGNIYIFLCIFIVFISISPLYWILYAIIKVEDFFYNIFAFMIVLFSFFLPTEILLNKLLKGKYLIKTEIKKGKVYYNVIFYIGFIFSILYLFYLIYIFVVS